MGLPRFKPSALFLNPRSFGRHAFIERAQPQTLSDAEAAWAMFQHKAALAVTQELAAAGETIQELATQLGEDPEWLMRKLHGRTPADLGDIMSWVLHYGIQVLPVFDRLSELKPE